MELLVLVFLILLNGVFSMAEIALVSARKTRLEAAAKKGSKNAQKALELANEPDRFLSTNQIGITLVGIVTGWYSGERFSDDLALILGKISFIQPYEYGVSLVVIMAFVTYLSLVLGELVPKRIGLSHPEQISKFMARPMNALSLVMSPFILFLSKSTNFILRILGIHQAEDSNVTEEDIKAIIQQGTEDGEIQEVEQDIVERVFNLGDRKISTLLTHKSELIWLKSDATPNEILEVMKQDIRVQYPVAEGDLDEIVGVVTFRDLFLHLNDTYFNLSTWIHPANVIPETVTVYGALERIKAANSRYALVADEFGSIEGIVTIKDILESLVGDVVAPGTDDYTIVEREDGSFLVDGQYPFYEFLDHFELQTLYSEYPYNTLSGLILDCLGAVPQVGTKLKWKGFEMEIVDMDRARIDKVLVKRIEEDAQN